MNIYLEGNRAVGPPVFNGNLSQTEKSSDPIQRHFIQTVTGDPAVLLCLSYGQRAINFTGTI